MKKKSQTPETTPKKQTKPQARYLTQQYSNQMSIKVDRKLLQPTKLDQISVLVEDGIDNQYPALYQAKPTGMDYISVLKSM